MKKYRAFSAFLFLLLILCTAMGVGPASASSLVMTPSETVSLKAGETGEISLGVDELPEGLSGYILTVKIDDPAVAEITAVSFPAWASPTENSALPASSVQITAAELSRKVQAGASDVPLATLTLRGVGGGTAGISVAVERMDSDIENTIVLDGAKNPTPKDDTSNPGDKQDEDKQNKEPERAEPKPSGSFGGSFPAETPETEEIEVPDEAENKTGEDIGQGYGTESVPVDRQAPEEVQSGNEDTKPDKTEPKNPLPGFEFAGTASVFLLFGLFRSSKR